LPTDGKPQRTWQEIAKELSVATDPQTITELSEELNRALEKRDSHLPPEDKRNLMIPQLIG
jgi:hypothetical protein